jgi:hypothetical protein
VIEHLPSATEHRGRKNLTVKLEQRQEKRIVQNKNYKYMDKEHQII